MSWELESAKRPGFGRRAGSPWALLGSALGLVLLSNGFALYYWIFAWIAPLLLTALLVLVSLVVGRHSSKLVHAADGAVAAAVFAATFAVAGVVVLSNLS